MNPPYKLGALAPQRPHSLSTLAVYSSGKLPKPPAVARVPKVQVWGMMDNDRLGCCTISGVGHAILAWNQQVGVHDAVPTDAQVESTYFDLTGGPDAGLVEANVLKRWHKHGLFGAKIAGYAPVETHDFVGLQQAIAFYGVAYLGVALPASAQDQFANNKPWVFDPKSPIEGGHCIVAVGYDHKYVYCVTWGGVVKVTWPWLSHYLTEAWAIISNQYVEAGRGPVLDLKTLQADLSSLTH